MRYWYHVTETRVVEANSEAEAEEKVTGWGEEYSVSDMSFTLSFVDDNGRIYYPD